MDYSAAIDSIRAERLELVEILAETRLQLLDTLNNLVTTSPSIILQDVSLLMAQYRQVRDNIYKMLNDMDALEQGIVSRIS